MTFTDPWLGGLGLLAAALVWWFDRRARRPRRVLIASHRLLPPPDPERARRAQRAMTLELMLLIAVALALGLAASGPVWRLGPGMGPVETVILVRDLSTRAGDGARLAAVTAVAEGLVKSRPAGTRFRLRTVPVGANSSSEPLSREALLEKLPSLSALPAIGDPAEAVEAALVGDPSTAIWLVMDRVPELPPGLVPFVGVRAVGAAMENVGIVGCGVGRSRAGRVRDGDREDGDREDGDREDGDRDEVEAVTVSVLNGGASRRELRLQIGTPELDSRTAVALSVAPGEVITRTIAIPAGLADPVDDPLDDPVAELVVSLRDAKGGPWRDSLAEDDRVVLVRGAAPQRLCALHGVWPAEALAVLEAFPGLSVEIRDPGAAEPPALSIFPDGVPVGLPTPSIVVVAPKGEEGVAVTARLEPHVDLPGLSPDRFRVGSASPELPTGLGPLSPVVTDEQGRVLVGLGGAPEARILVFGFRLDEAGGWVERESFARLLASFVDQVLPAAGGRLAVHRLREPAALPELVEPGSGRWTVRGPEGAPRSELSPGGAVLRAGAPGVYELESELSTTRVRLSFGVLDPGVTRLEAVELRREASSGIRASRSSRRVGLRGLAGLVALALALTVVARRSRRAES